MKKYIIIFIIFSCFSCVRNYRLNDCKCNYSVTIGNNLTIDKSEVENAILPVLEQNRSSTFIIEIVIYGNSSGKEIYLYSEDKQKEIVVKDQPGKIEALIKIKTDNRLLETIFLEAEGNGRKEILQKLAENLRKALCG
jgi:hypothetical protein